MSPDQLLQRVRHEYEELPGLRLTRWQAQRLWQLDPQQCERVLAQLVRSTFLAETRDGMFMRRDQQSQAPPERLTPERGLRGSAQVESCGTRL